MHLYYKTADKTWSVRCTMPITNQIDVLLCLVFLPLIQGFHMTSRRPCWCPKTMKRRPSIGVPNQSCGSWTFLMQTLSFVPIYLHRCWPREWKHSIQQEELMERRPNGGSYENHNSSYRSTFQWNFDEGEGNLVRIHLYLGLNFVAKNKCWLIFFSNFRTNIFKGNCLQKGK